MMLSIIIVSYKVKNLLRECLQSIYSYSPRYSFEVIVVENGSKDGTKEMIKNLFPTVKLIINDSNRGWGKALNQGITTSKGNLILIMDADSIVMRGTINIMSKFLLHHPEVGGVAPKLFYPNLIYQPSGRTYPSIKFIILHTLGIHKLFPKSRIIRDYYLPYLNIDTPWEVDLVKTSCFLVKKKVIENIGLIDERFFVYFGDVDWQYRMKKGGWEIYIVPEAKAIHYEGESTKRIIFKQIIEYHKGLYFLFKKHYSSHYSILIQAGVILFITIRGFIFLLLNIFSSQKSCYSRPKL